MRDDEMASGGRLRDVLHADDGRAFASDQARISDRSVGAWVSDFSHFEDDGCIKERYRGHVTFGWILQGQALQDRMQEGADA